MAVLEKMRMKMGIFISVIIAVALLAFIVDPETLQSTISMFSSKNNVGEMNGKSISYRSFDEKVENLKSIYQSTTGNTAADDQTMKMLRNSAWQNAINDYIMIPACKEAGITVGEKETVDMTTGADISPVLSRDPVFAGDDGIFSKEKFSQFIQNISKDASGSLRNYWNFIQDNMLSDRYISKYVALLHASTVVNNAELKRAVAENNTAYNVDFVIKPLGFEQDSTIKVSNQEIKDYYNKIKSTLKQTESRDAEFIAYDIIPSAADIKAASETMNKAYFKFVGINNADTMKTFLYDNSDVELSDRYFKKGELAQSSADLDAFVAEASAGAIFPLKQQGENFYAAKVMDVKTMPDSVFVRQIFCQKGEKEADSVMNAIAKGTDFTTVAVSVNPGVKVQNGMQPGDFGWMTQDYLMQGFEKVFTVKTGEIFKVKTSYGWHVAVVSKTTAPLKKSKVAILSKTVIASDNTYSKYLAEANTVVDQCGKNIKDFEQYARAKKLSVYPVSYLAPGSEKVGSYEDVRALSNWIFENKEGKVSPVIPVNNKYFFIAAVKKIHKDGYASINDVAQQIKMYLTMVKKGEKAGEQCKKAVGANPASLQDVANKLGLAISSQSGITFSTVTGQQQLDPKFVGAIDGAANTQKVVGPVIGDIGIYYFQIKGKEKGAYFTESDAKQKAEANFSQMANALMQIMSADANVKDTRYKFY